MKTRKSVGLLSGLALSLGFPVAAQVPLGEAPVTRIDHFYAQTGAIEELLEFFESTLGLPQAWPVQDYGTFASGAVSLGNVTFEVVRFANSPTGRATFAGIALEPVRDTDALLEWLRAVGMDHEPPRAFPPTGPAFFVNTALPQLSSEMTEVFVCDYKPREMILAGQAEASAELADGGGGPLGIRGVKELILESTDINDSFSAWSELAGTTAMDGEDVVVEFASGPAIRVVSGRTDGLAGLAIYVEALGAAAAFLAEAELASRGPHGELRIAPEAIGGLELTLIEG